MQLGESLAWIESTWPVRFIATAPVVYPLISAIHLIGIALVAGSIVPVDLRLLRVVGPQFDRALPSLIRIALLGFAVAASSGVMLASVRIGEYSKNPAFLTKLLILLASGVNALILRLASGPREIADMVGHRAGRITATASLCLWAAAVIAGRWIAFS